jgi:anti-sigma-K factor RskA
MSVDELGVDHEGCGGNAAPYVLGALTDEEHEAFLVHMESCSVCRDEVAALQVVAAALPAAAPQLSAPPELKRRLMSTVRHEARQRASREAPGRAAAKEPRRAWRGSLLSGLGWQPGLAAGALAAAAIALAVLALTSGSGTSGTSSAGARVIHAQVLYPHASASLTVGGGHAQLDISDMPQSAPGHVYEVWLKRSPSGRAIPTDALFTVDADGAASVGVPGSVSGIKEVMVTAEPVGGSRVPTLPVLIAARLS